MTNKSKLVWLAFLLVCLRLFFAIAFCGGITDADQMLFSLMAVDIQNGMVNAFFLYGQAYNFPFESWVAVPLLLAHVPWNFAVPIAASLLGIIPYLILSCLFYRKNNFAAAYLALYIPIILCPEFHYISTIPRGFCGALALFFSGLFLLIHGKSKISFFLATFFILFAIYFSANIIVLLFLIPIIFRELIKKIKAYLYVIIFSTSIACIAILLIQYYYSEHAAMLIHPNPEWDWSVKNIFFGLTNLPGYLFGLGPVFAFFGILWPLVLACSILLLWNKKEYVSAFFIGLFLISIFLVLGFQKIRNGAAQLDLPYARFWLYLPLAAIMVLPLAIKYSKIPKYIPLSVVSLFALIIPTNWYFFIQNKTKIITNAKTVNVYTISTIEKQAQWITKIRKEQHCKLVLIADMGEFTYLNSLVDRKGVYYYPRYERKYWVKSKNENELPSEFLYLTKDSCFFPAKSSKYHYLFLGSMGELHLFRIFSNTLGTYDFKAAIGF